MTKQARPLIRDDKHQAIVDLLEPYLAKTPDDASAHLTVARAYDGMVHRMKMDETGTPAQRRQALEKAAEHYWAVHALTRDYDPEEQLTYALLPFSLVYAGGGLNRQADAEKVARLVIAAKPHDARGYNLLARVYSESRRATEGTALLRKVRTELPPEEMGRLSDAMWSHVQFTENLPKDDVRAIVADLHLIADALLASRPQDANGPNARISALRLEAEYLETNQQKQQALLAEAKQWSAVFERMSSGQAEQMVEQLKELQQLHESRKR